MEETVVTKKEIDNVSIDPSTSSANVEALKHMGNGMYLIKKGNQEGGSYNWGSIQTMVKKGTIDKLLRLEYIYESEQNPGRFLLTKTGLLVTKYQ